MVREATRLPPQETITLTAVKNFTSLLILAFRAGKFHYSFVIAAYGCLHRMLDFFFQAAISFPYWNFTVMFVSFEFARFFCFDLKGPSLAVVHAPLGQDCKKNLACSFGNIRDLLTEGILRGSRKSD